MMLSVIFSAMLWFKTIVAVRRNSVVVLAWTVLGMSFIQTFSLVSQPTLMFLCVTLCRIPYFVYLLLPLGWLPGMERLIWTITMKLLFGLLGVFLFLWWWKL